MEKPATFGNVALAKKMAAKFGCSSEPFPVKMKYTKQVEKFIQKAEQAHKKTADSKLTFG